MILYIVVICIIILIAVFGTIFAIRFEKKEFNKGKCIKCGGDLVQFATDSQGGRCYKCTKCKYPVFISYYTVDKEFLKEHGQLIP